MVDGTQRYELFECGFDAAAAEMALEESTDLLPGQGAGCVDGFQDPVGGVVAGGFAKEERGAGGAVVPHREGCLKVRQPDNGAAVENSVYGTEAQNLSFGTTGGGAVETRTGLAQGRVTFAPESTRLVVTDKADVARIGGPIEGAAQFGGDGGSFMSVQVAAFRQALTTLHPYPETTVGEAVVRFCREEIVFEFALRDVGDQADMRAGGLDGVKTSERAEIATIPGGAEQRREVALDTPHGMEDGGEFFREREQPAVGGRLLIAQSIDKGSGRQASGGDAFGDPRAINFCEEASDLVPTCSLAGLAGLTDQHDEKVETMAGGIDHAVGRGTNGIAEGGQQLEEDGGGMGFAVRGHAAYDQPRDAVECGIAEDWSRGRNGRWQCGRRGVGL